MISQELSSLGGGLCSLSALVINFNLYERIVKSD